MRATFLQSGLQYGVLFALSILPVAHSRAASISGVAVCAQTPAAAVRLAQGKVVPAAEGKGYRVVSISWDPLLRQNRAMVENCEHPEWPAHSVIVSGEVAQAKPAPVLMQSPIAAVPVVHAGEVVRLWRREQMLRIETTGIAEQGGGQGETIRVRLRRRNTEAATSEKEIAGIVRGPQSVEIEP